MKSVLPLKTWVFFLALSTVLATGCSKDDDTSGEGDGGGEMTASIGGQSFKSHPISSNAVNTAAGVTTTLFVQGTNTDGVGITMNIMDYDGEGTYQFGPVTSNFNVASYTETDVNNPMATQVWSASYDTSSSGSITISEETSSGVVGTFSFKGRNGNDNSIKTISEGKFNLSFKSN